MCCYPSPGLIQALGSAIRFSSLILRLLYHNHSQPVFVQEETAISQITCSTRYSPRYILYYFYFTTDIYNFPKALSHLLLDKTTTFLLEFPYPNSCMLHLYNRYSQYHNIHVTLKKMFFNFSKQQQINGFSSGFLSCRTTNWPLWKCFPLDPNLPRAPPDTVWTWLSRCKCDSSL